MQIQSTEVRGRENFDTEGEDGDTLLTSTIFTALPFSIELSSQTHTKFSKKEHSFNLFQIPLSTSIIYI